MMMMTIMVDQNDIILLQNVSTWCCTSFVSNDQPKQQTSQNSLLKLKLWFVNV